MGLHDRPGHHQAVRGVGRQVIPIHDGHSRQNERIEKKPPALRKRRPAVLVQSYVQAQTLPRIQLHGGHFVLGEARRCDLQLVMPRLQIDEVKRAVSFRCRNVLRSSSFPTSVRVGSNAAALLDTQLELNEYRQIDPVLNFLEIWRKSRHNCPRRAANVFHYGGRRAIRRRNAPRS